MRTLPLIDLRKQSGPEIEEPVQAASSSCSIFWTTPSAGRTGSLFDITHRALCSISFLYRQGICSQGIWFAQGWAFRHLESAAFRYCAPRDVSTIDNYLCITIA